METVVINNFSEEKGKKTVHFDTNYTVTKIVVTLNDDKSVRIVDTIIEYAQNKVTTDLMSFANACDKGSCVIEFIPNAPIELSDIYITLPDENIDICTMEMFPAEDIDLSACYPLYFDKELECNYYLDTITIFTPSEGYSQYSIYTSLNGRDFDFVAKKHSDNLCPLNGETYNMKGKEARIIRVLIEYNSKSPLAVLEGIEYTGKKSGSPILKTPSVEVCDFENSEYNVEITQEDTINEIYGIIERRIGECYKKWFRFTISEEKEFDYFNIFSKNGKIHISGNNGISLASGLNHYLKYFCKVNISQVGDRVAMPKKPVLTEGIIHRETKAKLRYAYNYCTLSYSMPFWGREEWRNELDFLALNGVNVVLDITAQEEVWRRFLKEIGYSHKDIKKFLAGPGYFAWAYMANLTGFGGPVHDNWFEERCILARENHLIMRRLSMRPILQGYSGMVPCDILNYDSSADVISQGTWGSFQRPAMLRTVSPCFKEYAKKFYKAQSEVYGKYSNFYATDPFHEGGITADMKPREIACEILSAMLEFNSDSVWIIQSWQSNPTSELLAGIEDVGKEHCVVLDLYAEKQPNYPKGNPENQFYGYSPEFNNTPWIYCMLNNFGGRLGLHGHLDNMVKAIPEVFGKCHCITGCGITPEASANNPVLYEFLFDSIWTENAHSYERVNMERWFEEYCTRRYGKVSSAIVQAWEILYSTVYRAECNMIGQGAPECILNARPGLAIKSASSWGNAVIGYDKKLLRKALALLMEDYDLLKASDGYLYDVVTLSLQILSNEIQDIHENMSKAFFERNIRQFEKYSKDFLECADKMETIASTSKYYLFGTWVTSAVKLAENSDDFTRDRFEMNAKSLVTTWGAYNQSETGGLHDYSNRQWAGLIGDFYKVRWQKWIENRLAEIEGKPFENEEWFQFEWKWVRGKSKYRSVPTETDITEIMEEYYD